MVVEDLGGTMGVQPIQVVESRHEKYKRRAREKYRIRADVVVPENAVLKELRARLKGEGVVGRWTKRVQGSIVVFRGWWVTQDAKGREHKRRVWIRITKDGKTTYYY